MLNLENLRWGYKLFVYLCTTENTIIIDGVHHAGTEDGEIGQLMYRNGVLDTNLIYLCKSPTTKELSKLGGSLSNIEKATIAAYFAMSKSNKGDE